MSFGNKLKIIRRQKNISQESLALLLNVSRQSVSKWEQDICYPETEKLLLLSKELGVSLDWLMDNPCPTATPHGTPATGKITVQTFNGKTVVSCYKFISQRIGIGPNVPNYVLFGVDRAFPLFLGEHKNILGYYNNKDSIAKEIESITAAIHSGQPTYRLKYCAKVKQTRFTIQLDQ